jgi:hypothetical protein
MKQTAGKPSDGPPWEKLFDELIAKYFCEVEKHVEEKANLGDLIKMVELRHKLTPGGADQKRFWKLVDEIRQGTLDKKPVTKKTRTKTISSRKNK